MNNLENHQSRLDAALRASKSDRIFGRPFAFLMFILFISFSIVMDISHLSGKRILVSFVGILLIGFTLLVRAARLHWKWGLTWNEVVAALKLESQRRNALREQTKRVSWKGLLGITIFVAVFALYAVIKDRYFR